MVRTSSENANFGNVVKLFFTCQRIRQPLLTRMTEIIKVLLIWKKKILELCGLSKKKKKRKITATMFKKRKKYIICL